MLLHVDLLGLFGRGGGSGVFGRTLLGLGSGRRRLLAEPRAELRLPASDGRRLVGNFRRRVPNAGQLLGTHGTLVRADLLRLLLKAGFFF